MRVAIVGAGIAGAGLAAELADHVDVVLIEAEQTPGYHSTGRSAAFWHETLGGPLIRPLSRASLGDLDRGGYLTPRKALEVAEAEHLDRLDQLEQGFAGTGAKLRRIDRAGVRALVPLAKPCLVGGLVEEEGADIDVAALHAAMLARLRRAGGELVSDARVAEAERRTDAWHLMAGDRRIVADIVVDAAGAWADEFASLARVRPLGIRPMRRTIVQVRVTTDDVPPELPLVMDVAGRYYFRPQGPDRLWLCPHDETPVDPHDVAPEDVDVATAIHHFERVTDWRVAAVERKWAGLRSFAPDRLPVYGFDAVVPGFFWCAGQGGTGIQTAPAAARVSAALILGLPNPDGIDPRSFAPARFA